MIELYQDSLTTYNKFLTDNEALCSLFFSRRNLETSRLRGETLLVETVLEGLVRREFDNHIIVEFETPDGTCHDMILHAKDFLTGQLPQEGQLVRYVGRLYKEEDDGVEVEIDIGSIPEEAKMEHLPGLPGCYRI